ncbi:MAG: UvrD-helicase domain-containing protein [Bacteroidetes bacterium]|nr:UvrD-helicase domain-containing protein [Bacteroidota bacterium]
MSFLHELNSVQKEAVKTLEGPVMIVAGAGSGKTRVLTYRIAYLLQCGVPAGNIMALTFTNKAAREMRERIETVVPGEAARRICMGTFHSTFARLLRREADRIGFHRNFSIYDTDDSQSLIKNIMGDLGINTQQVAPAAVRHAISSAKNRMMTPEQLEEKAFDIFERKVSQVFAEYGKRLRAANAMDFDDLLLHPIRLLDAHPDVLDAWQQQFRFILIDEYQDTNQAQYQIVRRLAEAHQNICVVGDDAQSIYAFRGADIRNILDFERHFRDVKVFRLEQNYRSTKTILAGADSVIKHNTKQIAKTLWTENDAGDLITVLETADEAEEAHKIVQCMQEEAHRRKLQLNDFAVLYRTNAQSRAIEDAMRRSGIPYTIVGGVEFYRRKEIKDILGYLRLIVNPSDDEAALRVINYPTRGIGQTTVNRLRTYAADEEVTFFEAAINVARVPGMTTAAIRRVEGFIRLIQKYASLRREISAGELVGSLIDELAIVASYKNEGTAEARARLDNVQELLSAISDFHTEEGQNTLEAFLEQASLVSDIDSYDESRNAVTLMTLHAAKGLEFPVIFLVGMEEGLFPSSMAIDRDEVEEERRLCYVGMTRAMQKLYMTHARSRLRWGERLEQVPSRFLDEVDQATVQRESTRRRAPYAGNGHGRHRPRGSAGAAGSDAAPRKKRSEYSQIGDHDSYSQTDGEIGIGSDVIHATFGRGKLLSVQGSGEMARAVVLFDSVGKKTLVLKYAGLKSAS